MREHMNRKPPFKAGVVQIDVALRDISLNLQNARDGLSRLSGEGVELALLPEMWSCGFDYKRLADHVAETPAILQELAGIAARCKMIIAGSIPEQSGESIYNTLYIIGKNGGIIGTYRKAHLFSVTREHEYFEPGARCATCGSDIGVLGPVICYDIRFPEFSRALTLKGAEILIVSAQWPKKRIDHWRTLLSARAIENQVYVIAANRCGKDPGLYYGGYSCIIDPRGNVTAGLEESPGTAVAPVDLSEIDTFRSQIPCLKERKPYIYDI